MDLRVKIFPLKYVIFLLKHNGNMLLSLNVPKKVKQKNYKDLGLGNIFGFIFSERFVLHYIGRIPSISLIPSITHFM
jgi:hypothetical protein